MFENLQGFVSPGALIACETCGVGYTVGLAFLYYYYCHGIEVLSD